MSRIMLVAAAAALLVGAPAWAADHEVKMMNKGAAGTMVFEPAYLAIAPGDTVTFKAINPAHNAESIPGMVPEGAQPFKTPLSKDHTVTFEKEGLYGYKCMPHYGMGMVGLVQVGKAAPNAGKAAAVNHPGKAKERMAALITEAAKVVAAAN